MNLAAYFWLGLMVFFLVVEVAGVGLVSIWFAGGALASLITALLGGGELVQIVVFLAVSGVLLALLRPFARKFITPRITPTNVDSVIGTVGILTEDVDNVASTGRVKLGAMSWAARSVSGENIPSGTRVQVARIEGVKAIVEPVEESVVK